MVYHDALPPVAPDATPSAGQPSYSTPVEIACTRNDELHLPASSRSAHHLEFDLSRAACFVDIDIVLFFLGGGSLPGVEVRTDHRVEPSPQLDGTGITYETGDHVGIFPRNRRSRVEAVAEVRWRC